MMSTDPVERLRPHIGQWVAVKDDDVLVAADAPATVFAWLSQHGQHADSMFRVPESDTDASGASTIYQDLSGHLRNFLYIHIDLNIRQISAVDHPPSTT
jgi:hypothetical protein